MGFGSDLVVLGSGGSIARGRNLFISDTICFLLLLQNKQKTMLAANIILFPNVLDTLQM